MSRLEIKIRCATLIFVSKLRAIYPLAACCQLAGNAAASPALFLVPQFEVDFFSQLRLPPELARKRQYLQPRNPQTHF